MVWKQWLDVPYKNQNNSNQDIHPASSASANIWQETELRDGVCMTVSGRSVDPDWRLCDLARLVVSVCVCLEL